MLRLTEPFSFTAATLAARLNQDAFQPCASYQPSTAGWVPPLGRKAVDLAHEVNRCLLLVCAPRKSCYRRWSSIRRWPNGLALIEDRRQRMVRQREKQELREQLVQELLPRALNRSRQSYAYIDSVNGWLVVDSATREESRKSPGCCARRSNHCP